MKQIAKRTARTLSILIIAAATASTAANVTAATIFESGTLGSTGVTWQQALDGEVQGSSINSVVFSGVKFELASPVITTQVGGHVFSRNGGNFFGAIAALDDANDFPDSGDLSTPDILGTTLLEFPVDSAESFGDLNLSLDPGWYAFVFGSGLFGATGSGGMPLNNPDIGTPTYAMYQPGIGWFDPGGFQTPLQDYRFFFNGRVVPEPSGAVLVFVVAVYICLWGPVRKTMD